MERLAKFPLCEMDYTVENNSKLTKWKRKTGIKARKEGIMVRSSSCKNRVGPVST